MCGACEGACRIAFKLGYFLPGSLGEVRLGRGLKLARRQGSQPLETSAWFAPSALPYALGRLD